MSLNTNNNRRVWSNEAGYLHWLFGISFSPIDDEWEEKWEGIKTEYDKCNCGRFVEEKDELCKECFQNFLQKFKENNNGKKWNKEKEECFGCGDFGNCLNKGIPNKLYLCEDCFKNNMNCVPTECGCIIIRDSRDHDECESWFCELKDNGILVCADCYGGVYDWYCPYCGEDMYEKRDMCLDCINTIVIPTDCGCLIIRDSREHDECRCDSDGNNWICADCYGGQYDCYFVPCNHCGIGVDNEGNYLTGDICPDCMELFPLNGEKDYGEF